MLDIVTGFRFNVDFQLFENIYPVQFSEISGLSVSVETESIKEGGQNEYIQKLPTQPQYSNLVLKKGLDIDLTLYSWINTSIMTFEFTPITLTISMLNENQDPVISWRVVGAYPIKWEVSNLQADQSSFAIETIEIAYQQFYLI